MKFIIIYLFFNVVIDINSFYLLNSSGGIEEAKYYNPSGVDIEFTVQTPSTYYMQLDGGFFGTKIEGLASSNIKYEDAVKNIKMLREALVAMPRTAGLQTSQATNTAEGGTGTTPLLKNLSHSAGNLGSGSGTSSSANQAPLCR